MNIDWGILHWIQNYMACDFMNFIMPKITVIGDFAAIWLLAAIAMILSKKYKRQGVLVVVGILFSLLIGSMLLKNIVARPRPCWLDTSFNMLVAVPTDYSFPSGHTLASVTAATILTLSNKKFAFVAIPVALLIAFSRLYLYVHFPSDVLASIIIGIVLGVLVYKIGMKYPKINKKEKGDDSDYCSDALKEQ